MQEKFGKLHSQRNAVATRWYSNPLGKVHHCISECKNVYVVDFSPKSQDLNIIENIWDELNRRVRRTGAIPTTLNQLRAKLLYDRNILPQNYVQRFVTSVRGTYSLLSLHGYGRRCRI